MDEAKSYLGLDFSTQQLKAIVVNVELQVTHLSAVNFDLDLPEFRTHGGVIPHEDKLSVCAPTIMWVKALDMLLERLKLEGLDFSTVVSLSGAAQVNSMLILLFVKIVEVYFNYSRFNIE
uniref:Xylulose kinase n=1 Tax=Parasteatoda tepidariorum TaxID=114398 RepID=A0A2L2Z106_PARTP